MKTGEEFWRDTLGEGLLFAGAERCRPRGCAGWQKGWKSDNTITVLCSAEEYFTNTTIGSLDGNHY